MTIQGVPEKMKAVQLVEYNKPYQIRTIPTPSTLDPNELLVKIACASICHTEQLVAAGVFKSQLPCTASHEGSGVIVAVGSSQTSSWKPGDRVLCGITKNRCGTCPDCVGPENYTIYCPYIDGNLGVTFNGAFSEYMVIDGREASRLPDSIPFVVAAPLACAGKTIYRGLVLCREAASALSPHESHPWIALVGSGGGLGHLGVQMGRALGFRIVGIDARDTALELTRKSGADLVLDARQPQSELVSAVASATSSSDNAMDDKFAGVSASIVLADSGAALACAVTRMHGTVVHISQPDKVEVPFHELVFRDIRLRGSLLCSRGEAAEMLALVAEHGIKAQVHTYRGLESVEQCAQDIHDGKITGKGVIIVDEELCR